MQKINKINNKLVPILFLLIYSYTLPAMVIEHDYKKIKEIANCGKQCYQGLIDKKEKCLYADLSAKCIFTLRSFKESIEAAFTEHRPFVLAAIKDTSKNYHLFDATELNKYYSSSRYIKNNIGLDSKLFLKIPTTKEQAKQIYFYFLNPITRDFEYLGKDKNLWDKKNKTFLQEIIKAHISDVSETDKSLVLGLNYEFNEKIELAEFFYNCAIDKDDPRINYSLYRVYLNLCFKQREQVNAYDKNEKTAKIIARRKADRYYLKAISYQSKAMMPKNFDLLEKFGNFLLTRGSGKYKFNKKATERALLLFSDLKKSGYDKTDCLLNLARIAYSQTNGVI